MQEVKTKLKELRPGLREVAPLTWSLILGFGILNLVLGVSLMTYPLGQQVAIVTTYTPLPLHGLYFVILGALMLVNLWRNNWKWLRILLLAGLLIKAVWLFALVVRLFTGGNAITLSLWLFITHVQAVAYVHFIPTPKGVNSVSANGNNRAGSAGNR